MLGAKRFLLDGEYSSVVRLGLRVIALRSVERRQSLQGRFQIWMIRPEILLLDRQHSLQQRRCLGVSTLIDVGLRQVAGNQGDVRMARAQACFKAGQRPAEERPGLGVAPLLMVRDSANPKMLIRPQNIIKTNSPDETPGRFAL